MCTLSWVPLPKERGYALAMNRDERRTRARGLAPARVELRGVPVLLPTDPEAGGSWVSVNALGMSLALLNRYEETPHDAGTAYTSRGLLIRDLAGLEGPESARRELENRGLEQYRPFTLVSIGRDSPPHLFEWNGRALTSTVVEAAGLVRTSSGSDQAEAERVRGELFRAAAEEPGGLNPSKLEALHRSHLPKIGPLSICMHRDEASTVSFSLITVLINKTLFSYVDGPPGETKTRLDLTF
jgi:hypothetical protein